MIEQQSEDIIEGEIIEDDDDEIPDFLLRGVQKNNKNGLKLILVVLIGAAIYGSWWVANLPDAKQQSEIRSAQFEAAKQVVQQKAIEREEKQKELQQAAPIIFPVPEAIPAIEPPKIDAPIDALIDEKSQSKIKKLQAELQELRQANTALQQEHSQQIKTLDSNIKLAAEIAQNPPLAELLQSAISDYYAGQKTTYGWGELVKMRKIGAEHVGDDDASIIARVEYAAQHNQLKDAIELAQKLSVEASPHFKQWRKIAYVTLEIQRIKKEIAK